METTLNTAEALAELTNRSTVWAMDEDRHRACVNALSSGAPQAAVSRRSAAEAPPAAGVAILPIGGLITYRPSILSMIFGGTVLTEWRQQLRELVAAKNVRGVLMPISSLGGFIEGVTEVAAQIREARKAKPIVAIVDPRAASAAYWLASQATRVLSLRSGMVGSVGVFIAHTDVSEAERRAGIKTNYISSSPEKTELAPSKSLSKPAETYLQKQVAATFRQFVADVAAGRKTTVSNVRTNYGRGRMLDAPDALQAGMIDGLVDDPIEAVQVIEQLAGLRRAAWLREQELEVAVGGARELNRLIARGEQLECEARDEWLKREEQLCRLESELNIAK